MKIPQLDAATALYKNAKPLVHKPQNPETPKRAAKAAAISNRRRSREKALVARYAAEEAAR